MFCVAVAMQVLFVWIVAHYVSALG